MLFRHAAQLLCLSAAGLLVPTSLPAEETFRWKLGNPVSAADPFTSVLNHYADEVHRASEGRVEFDIVEIDTIGFRSADSLRVLRQDVVQAMFVFPQYVTRDEPLLDAMMPQGALLDVADNLKIIHAQEQIAAEILEKWNLVPVTRLIDPRSSRMGIVSTEPIRNLAELRTKKLRHFNRQGIRAFNSIGVSTQYIPSSELFMALRMGVVDAAVYSPSYIRSQGLYDVACCYVETGNYTVATPALLVAREGDWKRLPSSLQTILKDVGQQLFSENLEIAMAGTEVRRIEQWLSDSGMLILPSFSDADRRGVQRALLQSWARQCERLGPAAVRNRERILHALHAGEEGEGFSGSVGLEN